MHLPGPPLVPPIDQRTHTLKIRRIASSVALAAALALGATGCGLIAPQGTTEQYAPSDGIDVSLEGVEIRNNTRKTVTRCVLPGLGYRTFIASVI